VDEYRLWVNTENTEDIQFMEAYQKEHREYVTLEYLPPGVKHEGNLSICHFFRNCIDPNTIYVRFDDDIVWVDTVEKFIKFLKFRCYNPQYFLVYANTINNSICSHLHQKNGAIDTTMGICGYECCDTLGWKNGEFAKKIHSTFFEKSGDLSSFYFKNWVISNNERVSINVISWRGDDFMRFKGKIDKEEEQYLATEKPRKDNRKNIIFGDFICVHYAFYPQREAVDNDSTILSRYKLLSTQSP
jgi:hypothetical protein